MSDRDCHYLALKYTTTLNFWPLQELAFKDVDRLIEKQKRTPQGQSGETAAALDTKTQQRRRQQQQEEEEVEKQDNGVLWSKEPRLFAFECNAQGKRKYISTHLGRFINFYWRECDANNRHYYELIRENTSCRLYFDIEYNKKANPTIDDVTSEAMLEELMDELEREIYNVFQLSIDRHNIVDLDSSTENKFSRHLIVHMPNKELFRNNVECGRFVKNFISRLAEEVATGVMKTRGKDVLQNHLFVYAKELSEPNNDTGDIFKQSKTCIIDNGVYTRNRIFRILGSTKYGKPSTAALRISSSNKFPFPNILPKDLFMHSVAKVRSKNEDTPPEGREEGPGTNCEEEMENALSTFAKVFADTLVVPCIEDREGAPILSDIDETYPMTTNTHFSKTSTAYNKKVDQTSSLSHDKQYQSKIGQSPFPELDKFVNNVLATRKHINGSIRSWSIQNEHQLSSSIITYQIKHNRWCENIQRSHKSNNIMWHVSISELKYWQSCFDPDCRQMSFRGQETQLPSEIKDHISEILIAREAQVSDSFEKALLDLNIDEGNHGRNDSFYEFDESFERALLDLNLSQDSLKEQHQKCRSTNTSGDAVEEKETDLTQSQSTSRNLDEKDDLEIALGGLNLKE